MFCSNCGLELNGKFCSNCGAGVSGGAKKAVDSRIKGRVKFIAIVAASIAVIVGIVVGASILGNQGENGQSTGSNSDNETRSSSEYKIVSDFFNGLSAGADACFSQGAFRSVATSYFTDAGLTYEEVSSAEMTAAIALVFKDNC